MKETDAQQQFANSQLHSLIKRASRMKQHKVVIIIAVLFLVGLCSIKVSAGDFFFTTKYYKTALAAYIAGRTNIAFLGDTEVRSEMEVLTLDDEAYLFIGKVDADHFVGGETAVKMESY